ncbi:F-box protein At5g07610-like [Silene latifolia]|uniref:F-box protein At5g07610-like n=1 Tax=Silene latifolia TaxID=37657 RepID=UPI003D77ED98
MEVKAVVNVDYDDNDEYLSADESGIETEDLSAGDLSGGLYFSLPDINFDLDFGYQLTEPLFPTMSNQDFLRYYSLDPPSVSGLVLIPKQASENPPIEYVSLNNSQTSDFPDFSFLQELKLTILQSCNELLLCYSHASQSYYISNLATHQIDQLPSFPVMGNISTATVNLGFDPKISPNYKVISVQKLDPKLHQISIYSDQTRTWTISGKPFDAPGDMDFNEGVFCNGAIHWMRRTPKGLYFDVNTEILKEMPKPPVNKEHSLVSCEYFGGSYGRLYYGSSSPDLPYFELFEMKEDYSGWFLKTWIDLQVLAMDFPLIARRSKNPHPLFGRYEADIISVVQDQYYEDFEVILAIPGEVIAYNPVRKFATNLCDLRLSGDDRAVWYRIYSCYQVL